MKHINKALLLLFFSLINIGLVSSQVTPGLIINPANAPGNAVLDPDLDGYVSKKTNGIQMGFTNPPANDVIQSEIPYVFIVKPDPRADLLRGGTGGATEIVGTDAAGNNAVLTYTNGVNLLYRFRIDSYSKATLSYSILIDTDGKFGFTGINADPNAVSGNPGFEIEINLQSNFRVAVYKIDGTTTPVQVYVDNNLTHQQKAIAYSTAGGDPDYFYDFYVPMSALTGITFSAPTTPTTITASTPMRYAAVTSMNPSPFIGNQAVSDVGGVTTNKSVDEILKEVIDSQTPTPPGTTSLQASACPTINDVAVSNTAITGTSTEASGTSILVQVYNGTNLVGSGTTTTSGSNWTINVSSLGLPGGVLVAGYTVKATATAVDKGASFGCSTKTVISCTVATPTPLADQITLIGGNKGFTVNLSSISAPVGTIVSLYKADFTLMTGLTVTNPYTTTEVGQTFNFQIAGTGQSWPNGVYYFTYQYPGYCVSNLFTSCLYATAGTSAAPTITTTNISTTTTTIQGTGNAVPSGNVSSTSIIHIYADGVKIASTTIASGSTSFSVSVSGLQACQVITAKQITTGTTSNNKTNYYCLSAASNAVTVTRKAATPTIEPASCLTSPYSINGRSTENGATITLYDAATNNPISGGTATVSNGVWYMPNLSLSNNQGVYAKVTSGTCLTASDNSATTTVTTRPSASSYSIVINAPTIGDDVITGTISGGSYPVTIKTYVNGALVGSGVTQSSAGTWTVSGVQNYLTINQIVKVTVTTGAGCESELSTAQAIVQCLEPPVPSYSGGGSVCKNQAGTVNLTSSETGRVYQLVNSSDVAVGPSAIGTGSPITLYTYGITSDLSGIRVKVYDVINPSCSKTGTNTVSFTVNNYVPTVTFSSTSLSVLQGQTSVNMAYTAKSSSPSADTYTIEYSMAAKNQGFQDRTTQNIPASPIQITVPSGAAVGTYSGTITIYSNEPGTCTTRQDFTITVYASTSTPVIGVQPAGKTICSGSTTTLSATASSSTAMTFTWQSSSSYNGTYSTVFTQSNVTTSSYTTGSLTATTYYRVLVSNTNGTTTSDVAIVTVNSTPAVAVTISGPVKVSRGATFVNYSIPAVSGATNYIWHYSGTGVTILGNTNSVFLSFSANATSGNLTVQTSNDCGTASAGTALAITFDEICAWRSVKNGNWTDYTVWYKLDCSTGTWSPAATYPNNDRPIYVYDDVVINTGEFISADSLYVKPGGVIIVNQGAALTATDELIIGIDTNGNAGQINSSGACNNVSTSGAKVIVRKALDSSWDFISFPFEVPAANVYHAGTNTNAVWGNINPVTTNASFFAAQYNGADRALDKSPSSNSKYFGNVTNSTFVPVRGYIVTGGNNGADSIDFVAATNTQLTLCGGSYSPENYLNPCECNDGWCLVGTPYVSAYNLYYADKYKTYYVAPTYTPVAESTDYKLNSFGAFFIQATAATPIIYNELGIANPTSHPSPAPRFNGIIELQLRNMQYTDNAVIRLGEDASEEYVLGEDALKIQTIAAASPQIYTEAIGACSGLFVNSLPANTERVDLQLKINSPGTHTIKISKPEQLRNINTATLVDTETGLRTDLITNENGYTFDAISKGVSNRFYIMLATNTSVKTGKTGNEDINVLLKGRNITLTGIKGNAYIRMYDVVGKLMYQYKDLQNGQSIDVNVPGVYLLEIKTDTQNERVKVLIQD